MMHDNVGYQIWCRTDMSTTFGVVSVDALAEEPGVTMLLWMLTQR